jgi:hypothetical protein
VATVSLTDLDSEEISGPYRVTTRSGEVHIVDLIVVEDSVMVLDHPAGTTFGGAGYPIQYRLEEIQSIETQHSTFETKFVVVTVVAVAIAVYLFLNAVGNMLSGLS